jgi:hypothetical protein
MIKVGNLRADKVEYVDGIGCCIWYPLGDDEESAGICFDFPFEDIEDMIKLLNRLKDAPIDTRVDAEGRITG